MKKIFVLLSVFVLSLQDIQLKAQTDTLYWFAAPWVTPDSWWRDNLGFHISTYSNTTTVRIKQPASTFDTLLVIPPYSSFDKYFNYMIDSLENKPADKILCRGFRISSNFPISVVYDELSRGTGFFNTETYSCKGKAALGTNFIIPAQTTYSTRVFSSDLNGDATVTQSYGQFNIVASENNTTVWITPKCAITGHAAGVTYSVFLPGKGMTYTGQNVSQATSTPSNNMSGTTVTSDKPIAVTVSDDSMMPGGGGCYDLTGDQIVPVENTGKEYIAIKGLMFPLSNESVFIVGTQNSTSVTIDDGFSVTNLTLNASDTKTFVLTQSRTYIQSSSNVYVLHISGNGCETGSELLRPLSCFGADQITFSRMKADAFYLNIYCKNGSQSTFTLDGSTSLVPASAFTVVPGTAGNWVAAQIAYTGTTSIPVGTHTISNTGNSFGFGILNGNSSNGVSFHYMNEFPSIPNVSAGTSQTICANTSTIQLNGSINNGNATWSTNGTGTFTSLGNLNTTYTLSPGDAVQSQLTFYLTANNCVMTQDSLVLTINPTPFVSFAPSPYIFCLNSGTVNLMVNIPGGVFTGSMVTTGGVFNPGAVGVFTVGYAVTFSTGCTSAATETMTVNPCTGVQNLELSELRIYPNPVTDIISIEGVQGINYSVTIFDVTGKIVFPENSFISSAFLSAGKLNSGMYYLKITSGKTEKYIKLSKL